MGYPGDRGQPGGWENEQSPQPPYGENPRRPESPRYGQSPFEPPPENAAFPPPGTGDSDPSGAFARPVGRHGYGGDETDPAPGPGTGAADADDLVAGTYDYGGHRRTGSPTDPATSGAAGAAGAAGPFDGSPARARQGSPYEPNPYESNPYEPNQYEPDPYSAGRYGGGDGDRDGRFGASGPTPPRGRSRLPLIIGAAAAGLLVLVAGGVGLSAILKDDKPKAKAGADSTAGQSGAAGGTPTAEASPSATPSAALGALLKSRATDPAPLTVAEIFRRRSFSAQGKKYVMTARTVTTSCTKAVNGAKFAATLKKAGCNQILRATFARSDGKLIGTLGVVNLRTEALAKASQRAATAKDAWVLPLAGAGTTKKIGTGIALGTAETRGHYLVTTWVQQPSGKEMSRAQAKEVTAFGRAVALGSNLTTALQYRGITGKPYGR